MTDKLKYTQKELDRQLDNQKELLIIHATEAHKENKKLLKQIEYLEEEKEALELEIKHLLKLVLKYKEITTIKEELKENEHRG